MEHKPDVLPAALVDLVEALAQIAANTAAGRRSVSTQLSPTRDRRYFEPYFQELVRRGILRSARGPAGGVWLAMSPEDITIGDIAHIARAVCGNQVRARQDSEFPLLNLMRDRMIAEMDAVTLAEVMREARKDAAA